MKSPSTARLRDLSSDHPEWNPWLTVVREVLTAATDHSWDAFVPLMPRRSERAPLLAEASIVISIDFLRRWLEQLFHAAALSETAEMATLKAVEKSAIEPVELFRGALSQSTPKLERMALDCGADAKAFVGVAVLVPVPFLHACRRLSAAAPSDVWTEHYCSLCGAWPVIAEIRGIERARYLRCGRCGQEWQMYGLRCPYCNMDNHEQLLSLVPQNGATTRIVEACKGCRGYLKSLTTLQGADPLGVMIQDLGSVDLDIAALDQGYRRPEGPGYSLNPTVEYHKQAV